MTSRPSDSEQLVERAAGGDPDARQELLTHYQGRLRQMVAARIDHRLAARVDPSDVVQEAMIDAARRLDDYLRDRPLPFYVWLRRLAHERLLKLHRRHIRAQRRSVAREEPWSPGFSEESVRGLGERLMAGGSSPSRRLARAELRDRLQSALGRLPHRDREILVMRNLEQLSVAEAAAELGISAGAVKVRHLRALQRLRDLLDEEL